MTETIVAVEQCELCVARASLRLRTEESALYFCQHHGNALINTCDGAAIDKWTVVGEI